MSTMQMRRWRAVCAYDGTDFDGWQSQPSGQAIQDIIEVRLGEVLKGPVRIHGSGRTDAGVHALGQVFHFDATWPHAAEKLRVALQVGLPPTIRIGRVAPVSENFHARFSAVGKRYSYRLVEDGATPFEHRFAFSRERPRRLDVAAMQRAAELLQGQHDFRAYAADNGMELEDPVRHLRRAEVQAKGRRLKLIFEADGFLYKMVRSLTGALVAVGEGRMGAREVESILRSGKRTEVVETAPPQGLFLERVFY
jgi:tRNA pseudouridine38-40 synthase